MLLYLPFFNQNSRIITYKFEETEKNKIDGIRNWAITQNPSLETSSHWWFNKLPQEIKDYYRDLSLNPSFMDEIKKKFGDNYEIDCLFDMNEVYISPPSKIKGLVKTSDIVFYTHHIDGPYYYFPLASCYRTIIALDDNEEIKTIFPLVPYEKTLKTGELVSFDYHRESHFIKKNEGIDNKDFRAVLKVHYCIYPRWFSYFGKMLGRMSIHYNRNFRNLFLYTIDPKTTFEKISAEVVIKATELYNSLEVYIGFNNISFISLLLFLSYLYDCFLIYEIAVVSIIPMRLLTTNNYNNPILVRDCNFYMYLCMIINFNNYTRR